MYLFWLYTYTYCLLQRYLVNKKKWRLVCWLSPLLQDPADASTAYLWSQLNSFKIHIFGKPEEIKIFVWNNNIYHCYKIMLIKIPLVSLLSTLNFLGCTFSVNQRRLVFYWTINLSLLQDQGKCNYLRPLYSKLLYSLRMHTFERPDFVQWTVCPCYKTMSVNANTADVSTLYYWLSFRCTLQVLTRRKWRVSIVSQCMRKVKLSCLC